MVLPLDPQQVGLELGGGAVVGAVIGFAAKKVAKIIAIIVGLELALFKFLETRGVLSVDWSKVTGAGDSAVDKSGEAASWGMSLIAAMPVGVGFTGGFVIGFKKG